MAKGCSKEEIIDELFSKVQAKQASGSSEQQSNFVSGCKTISNDSKVVYRSYASLTFIFLIDSEESELGTLDLIHVFVEILD